MARLQPKTETVKKLFSFSGNKCAFPTCSRALVTQEGTLVGEICHIEGAEESAPRYNPLSDDEQRRHFDNLILFCGTCHTIVDRELATYTVEKLKSIKQDHESKHASESFSVSDKLIAQILDQFESLSKQITASTTMIKEHISTELDKHLPTTVNKPLPNPLLESNEYQKLSLNTQLPLFKKQVVTDYETNPNHRFIISNFHKFEGKKYFVYQKYKLLKSRTEGDNILAFTLKLIKNNLKLISTKKSNTEQITKLWEQILSFSLHPEIIQKIKLEPKTWQESQENNKQIEEKAFEGLKISSEQIIQLNKENELKSLVDNEPMTITKIHSTKNKISKLREILNRPDVIKNEIAKLSANNGHDIEEGKLIIDQKEELRKELYELDKNFKKTADSLEKEEIDLKVFGQKLAEIQKAKEDLHEISETKKTLSHDELIEFDKAVNILEKIKQAKEIWTEIKSLTAANIDLEREKLIPIVGDYGSGKSALSHHIFYMLCKDEDLIPIFIPLGLLKKHEDLNDYLREDLLNYLKTEYKFNINDDELKNLIESGKLIFILDALDEMSTKLDNNIAQSHLSHIISLAKTCVVLMTSRETYLSDGMKKNLLEYEGLIKILDFDEKQIEKFLHLHLPDDPTKVSEIKKVIEEEKFLEFSRKPLFLDAIFRNFETLKTHIIINESVILEVLTDQWIRHDRIIKEETDDIKRKKIIHSRQKISEILAFAEYRKGQPIGIEDIKTEVKEELQHFDADAESRLSEYYQEAIGSTFLINEENETYRFVLKPIMEYFIARRIVSEINNNQVESLVKHIDQISSDEIFNYIKGAIDSEWGIKPHLFSEVQNHLQKIKSLDSANKNLIDQTSELEKIVRNKETKSKQLFNTIRTIGANTGKPVSKLLKILYISGNLPPRPNLSHLTLHKADLRGANLTKADLRGANLSDADLTGADLTGTDLTDAKCKKTIFIGCKVKNTVFNSTDLEYAEFSNSRIEEIFFNKITNFKHVFFNGATLKNIDFTETDFRFCLFIGCIFADVKLYDAILNNTDLRSASLRGMKLRGATIIDSDLSNAYLERSDLIGTKFNRSNLNYADLTNASTDNKTDFSSCKMIETKLAGVNIHNTIHYNLDLTQAIGVEKLE